MAIGIVHGREVGNRPRYPQEFFELMRIIIVAGIPLGIVVIGGGSRLAMYLLRLTSPDSVIGQLSDDAFVIGEFTLASTYNLLNVGGMLGVIGAAACVAVAPWLIGPGWLRLLAVGLTAAALVGSGVIIPEGNDFAILGPTWFAVALFTGLPFIAGVLLMLAVDREASTETWAGRGGRRRWIVPCVLMALVPFSVAAVVVVGLAAAALLPLRRQFLEQLSRSRPATAAVQVALGIIPVLAFLALWDDLTVLF